MSTLLIILLIIIAIPFAVGVALIFLPTSALQSIEQSLNRKKDQEPSDE